MKIKYRHLFILCYIFVVSCKQEPDFYRGNMHAHSYWSDGDHYPEMVMEWYKTNGYHFAVLSDHNVLQEGEKWFHANRNETTVTAYSKYLKRFGEEWIEEKIRNDSHFIRLRTFREYNRLFDEPDVFLTIPAEEITDEYDGKPVHMNAVNLKFPIPPQHGSSVVETMNHTADAIYSQEETIGRSIFSFINHPNFGWAMTKDDLVLASGFTFFEVYNGHPSVRNYGDSTHSGTEDLWDQVNIDRLQRGIPVLMAVATDDAHNYHEFRPGKANPGRGWVVVRAQKLDSEEIIRALRGGDFYASTGVVLEDFSITSERYLVKVCKEPGIRYTIRFIGCRKGSNRMEILAESTGTRAEYRYHGDELFVRAKVLSSKPKSNPFAEGDKEVAWLQPVVL